MAKIINCPDCNIEMDICYLTNLSKVSLFKSSKQISLELGETISIQSNPSTREKALKCSKCDLIIYKFEIESSFK